MTGYDFHPQASLDLDEIWEFIGEANLDAADRVIADILAALDKLVPLPNQGHKRPDLTSRPLRFALATKDIAKAKTMARELKRAKQRAKR